MMAMITKNSLSQLGSIFKKALEASLQVPYHAIILIDDGTDDTSKYVTEFGKAHGKEVIVNRSRLYGFERATRATARQTAIDIFFENFSDEWLFFLDDDAILQPGWWDDVKKYVAETKVGEIWGVNWEANEAKVRFYKRLGIDMKEHLIRAFKIRGGTHDTLYRRQAIKGIFIPPCLHEYEDAFIHHWVLCRGWEYRISLVGVKHMNPREAALHPYMLPAAIFELLIGLEKGYTGRLKDYMLVLRPVVGFFIALPSYISVYGLRRGVKYALKAQYVKMVRRLYLARAARILRKRFGDLTRIRICDLILQKENNDFVQFLCSV